MAIHCVVFALQRSPEEYQPFFRHLDEHQGVVVCANCRLLFSRHSAEVLKDYLQNFVYADDVVLVAETSNHWALNRGFEATEWLRELQHLHQSGPTPPAGG